jgi:hypothetical protein
MKYKPPSIEEIGLDIYLDSRKEDHNDFGYHEFMKMVENEVNPTNIAKAFNVDRRTVIKWVQVYNQDKTNATS